MSTNTSAIGPLWDKTTWRLRALRDLAAGRAGGVRQVAFGAPLMADLVRDGIYTPDFPPRPGDSIIIETDSGPSDFTVYEIRGRVLCEENSETTSRELWFDDGRDLRWHVLSRSVLYKVMAGDLALVGTPVEIAPGIWEIGRKRLPGRDASKVIFIEGGVPAATLELVIARDSFNAFCILSEGSPPGYGWHSEKTLVGGTIEVRGGRFASDVFEDLSASQPETSVETRVDLDAVPPRLWIRGKEFALPAAMEGFPTDGCRYLGCLFEHAEKPISCWDLYLAIHPEQREAAGRPGWSDEVIDHKGKLEFRAQLKQARADLTEAESDEFLPAIEQQQLRDKVAELEEQAAKLFGKRGRSRLIAEGDRGKARQRVRKALNLVIAKVKEQDDTVGAALAEALGKGDPVMFRPPPDWEL